MKTAFEELMIGLDEVQVFLAGEGKGFNVHVPDEVIATGAGPPFPRSVLPFP